MEKFPLKFAPHRLMPRAAITATIAGYALNLPFYDRAERLSATYHKVYFAPFTESLPESLIRQVAPYIRSGSIVYYETVLTYPPIEVLDAKSTCVIGYSDIFESDCLLLSTIDKKLRLGIPTATREQIYPALYSPALLLQKPDLPETVTYNIHVYND